MPYNIDTRCSEDFPERIDLIAQRMVHEFCVAMSDDAGYQYWIWFPPVPPDRLEDHWRSTPSGDALDFKQRLGGDWFRMWDNHNRRIKLGKHWITQHFSKDMRLYLRLALPGLYSGEACCDHDSRLADPSGKMIYHDAFSGQKLDPDQWKRRFAEWSACVKVAKLHWLASLPLKRTKGMPKRRPKQRAKRIS